MEHDWAPPMLLSCWSTKTFCLDASLEPFWLEGRPFSWSPGCSVRRLDLLHLVFEAFEAARGPRLTRQHGALVLESRGRASHHLHETRSLENLRTAPIL